MILMLAGRRRSIRGLTIINKRMRARGKGTLELLTVPVERGDFISFCMMFRSPDRQFAVADFSSKIPSLLS
jgi:hypothetical protein